MDCNEHEKHPQTFNIKSDSSTINQNEMNENESRGNNVSAFSTNGK